MAVDANQYKQSFMDSGMKPSRIAGELHVWLQPDRFRVLSCVHAQGGQTVSGLVMPWDGVIESIRATQQVAGGGAGGQNLVDVLISPLAGGGPTSLYTAANDGNIPLDNAAAGTTTLNYATAAALLVANNDGVSRVRFLKGDVLAVSSTPAVASLGTVLYEIEIAREFPIPAV